MTGTEFAELVASLCRRNNCTEVRRVGGADDNGADVVDRLSDGRAVLPSPGRPTYAARSRPVSPGPRWPTGSGERRLPVMIRQRTGVTHDVRPG
ncbi:restriction endonuclease [Streptomyces sp. NPDC056178]|uniref:restriction endonuclease n=1 Tax=Streptomyces sp. NPDC056178 TaxID=3345735 RepID=UPI0035D57652